MKNLLITLALALASCGPPEDDPTFVSRTEAVTGILYKVTYPNPHPSCMAPHRVHGTFRLDGGTLDGFWQANCPAQTDCSQAYFVGYGGLGADYLGGNSRLPAAFQNGRPIYCAIKTGSTGDPPLYGGCWFFDGDFCGEYFTAEVQ